MTARTGFTARRAAPYLVALSVASALGAALYTHQSQAEAPVMAEAAVPVSVSRIMPNRIKLWEAFSGRLESVERVELRPRVAGTIQGIHFREGALVARGDLLITIDPAPYAAQVAQTEAVVEAARARLAQAGSDLTRAQRLIASSAIAQRDLDQLHNAKLEAVANLRGAEASLQAARLNLDYTRVRAPISGRIGRLDITVGNQVAAGPTAPVMSTLVSVSPIYASFDVSEATLDRLQVSREQIGDTPVQLGTSGMTGTPLEGRLQFIDNQVDAGSGTLRVRATLDNRDGSLIPGQFARIRLGSSRQIDALLVSERAIGSDQSKQFVMVVGEGNRAEYREVSLGMSVEGERIVTRGLQPGERVIVDGLQRVRPGTLLAPSPIEPTALTTTQARTASRG